MPKHPYNRGKGAPDPQLFILVRNKEGWHYRRRRGTVKKARLNEPFQKSADDLKQCSPAAKRLRGCLSQVFRGLNVGRAQARFSGFLKKAILRKGYLDFSAFAGYDFQQEHPLGSLLLAPLAVEIGGGEARVRIEPDAGAVKQKNALVSHYYFDLVLVWGNAGVDGGLRLDSVSSALYPFGTAHQVCKLSLALPESRAPWMLLLKTSCLEGNELAHHPRHYGMKVVAVGESAVSSRQSAVGKEGNGEKRCC